MNRRVLIGSLTLLGLLNLSRIAVGQKDVGYLKVDANPGRAGVFVDDKYLGPSPGPIHGPLVGASL
jgi:hypothetical protein